MERAEAQAHLSKEDHSDEDNHEIDDNEEVNISASEEADDRRQRTQPMRMQSSRGSEEER